MKKYDLCVIGAGPSGYAAAMRALDFGKKVILVEKNRLGGTGLFNGALSSKTLWELSESYKVTRANNLGFNVYDSELNYGAVLSEMENAVNERYRQLKEQIDYFQRKGELDFEMGHASLLSPNEVSIQNGEEEKKIAVKNVILAVGSRPRILPHIPVDEKTILTSDGLGSLKAFPESIVILGAGVIGCEFATIFSNFGKTKVSLIDKKDRILPFEDEDLSNTVAQNLRENGVLIHQGASLKSMDVKDGMVEYTLEYEDGRKEIFTVEKALVSVGRVPNYEHLGLEKLGIKLTDRGYAIDKSTQTNIPNIYAVGDFTADIALVNVAELEGRHAVERIFGKPEKDLFYNNISTIMFLNPEVATVGINEQQAREKGIPYKVACMQYRYVNRAIAMRNTRGFFKILVTDDDEMKILGMRVLGAHASSTIQAVALLISMNKGIRELAELIHPHPSIPEGIQEGIRMLLGKSIIKPQIFQMKLKCYRFTKEGRIENLC